MTGVTVTIRRNRDTEGTVKISEASEEPGIGNQRKENACTVATEHLVRLSPAVMLKAKLVSGEFCYI